MTREELWYPIWFVFIAVVIVYLVVISYFFRHLKMHHEAVWIQLGSPSLFLNNSLLNNWLVLKFLVLRRYRRLVDPRAALLGNIILALLVISSSLFLFLSWLPKS